MDFKKYWQAFKIIKGVQGRNRLKIWRLLRLFGRADRETRAFRKKTGLRCVNGCGRCCENPNVNTTVLEVLPLAIGLWQRNEALAILEKADKYGGSSHCLFYKPDPLVKGRGRCSIYSFRPLVCRLFGFSAVVDKNRKAKFSTCAVIKENQRDEYNKTYRDVETGKFIAPQMKDFGALAFNLDPELSRDQLPINEAIKIAVEKTGLWFKYAGRRFRLLKGSGNS